MAGNTSKNNQNEAQQPQGGETGASVSANEQLPLADVVVEQTPEWLQQLLDSNQTVIDSNNALVASNESVVTSNDALIEAVGKFNEHATELVREILEGAKAQQQVISASPSAKSVELDPDADYVVAPGKSFHNKDTGLMQIEGDDVTHFEPERLKNLISQGIVTEA